MAYRFSLLFSCTVLLLLCGLTKAHSQCSETEVNITSITSDWGVEMSWELHDTSGILIASWEGVNNNDTASMLICVEDGCYTLTAYDVYGDGWNGGSVELDWGTSSMIFELPDGAVNYFYFGINSSNCIPVIPGCTDPSAFNYNILATVDDGSCLTTSDIVAAQIFDTICYSGSKDNRINWVLQNRSNANPNSNFADAAEFRNALEQSLIPAFTLNSNGAKTPYAQYKNFFNLYAAWWPDAPGDHSWWHFSVIKALRDEVFLPWTSNETGWVTWFSTTKFGGGGGAGLNRDARVGDGKMYGTDFETLLHEFGHTMPGLLDEYTSSGEWSGNQCFETPNTTEYTILDSVPWRKWVEKDTPLPTPYNGNFDDIVGVFEGGLTNYFGCHRPTAKACYMGAGGFGAGFGQDLCAPCTQRVICFLYKYVNVIENPIPANPAQAVTGTQTVTFSADVVVPEPNTQKYEWFLNGKRIAQNTTTVDVTFGSCDNYTLKFAVTDTTELVRYDEKFDAIYPRPYREFVWEIDQTEVNTYDLNSTATVTNANCTGADNGIVGLSINGGQAPYETWLNGTMVNNPATDLAPGVQQFTVVDARGCAVEETVMIGQDELLDLETCSTNDGGWEVTAVSSNYDIATLDLLWSTGETGPVLSGISDGDYSLTATVNGCSVTEAFSLANADPGLSVSATFIPSEIERATGAIYVEATGGTPNYQIEWYDRLMSDRTDDNINNISASGTTWGHLPEMAFDNDLGTKWLHAVSSDAWIAYNFPQATTIAYYAITAADDVPDRDPQNWRVEGSDDGNNWTVLDSRNNEDFLNRFQRRVFPIANPQAFHYFRLFVTASAGENQIQVQEIEFIGTDSGDPFLYNAEFDGHFSRSGLAPGDYHYAVSDASAACADADIQVAAYEAFIASGLSVVQDGNCEVAIESPNIAYDYYWLSDAEGSEILGTGPSFEPPYGGNYYVTAAPSGTGQWSQNRKGFAVTMPNAPEIEVLGGNTLSIIDPKPNEEYLWYDANACGTPIHIGNNFVPGPTAMPYYIAARSTVEYPDPIDPATVSGLLLQMDASDLDGDGVIDDPAPETSSILDWSFPTGNNWATDNWFAYRSNHQNGVGIADWATLWLQRIENGQSGFQTVLMAYEENALSVAGTGPMEALSATIPRHTDSTQLFSDNAPATTLNGTSYLNGQEVDPLNTANPMAFCVLGAAFTSPSNATIFYTDTHWEGKVGEMLFYDHALSDAQMLGVSEYLRQKWISTAVLESPRTPAYWTGSTLNIEEKPATHRLRVYPNPTENILALQVDLEGLLQVRIFDLHGRLLRTKGLAAGMRIVDVSGLQAGVYLIEVASPEGIRMSQRFIKM